MAYGFNMAILEDQRSIPLLWEQTKDFIKANKNMLDENADFEWLMHDPEDDSHIWAAPGADTPLEELLEDREFNGCQFFSNFEIGSLDFFRGDKHMAFFNYIDTRGGFYYARTGDAPIHTLSVSMFLPKRRVWYFRDIGYSHGVCEQCPPHETHIQRANKVTRDGDKGDGPAKAPAGAITGVFAAVPPADNPAGTPAEVFAEGLREGFGEVFATVTKALVEVPTQDAMMFIRHHRWALVAHDVKRQGGIPGLSCGCTITALDENFSKLVPYRSKQRKPSDTCIRRWLGGKWLEKKPGWTRQADIAVGGDGYGGYVLDGLLSNPFTEPQD